MFLFRISKNQLQLLGAACLFLASKFKAVDHISSEKLVMYTDYSITTQELKVRPLFINSYFHLVCFYGLWLYFHLTN